jgi:hypothetical protein
MSRLHDRPVACKFDGCPAVFRRHASRNIHCATVHGTNRINGKYSCIICPIPNWYLLEYHLLKHQEKYHGKVSTSNEAVNPANSRCDKSTQTSTPDTAASFDLDEERRRELDQQFEDTLVDNFKSTKDYLAAKRFLHSLSVAGIGVDKKYHYLIRDNKQYMDTNIFEMLHAVINRLEVKKVRNNAARTRIFP